MAYTSGTVNGVPSTSYGHNLLMDALITFLTTDATLVAAGQNWTVLRDDGWVGLTTSRYVYLKGPGLSGSDEVYVNIVVKGSISGTLPYFNWDVRSAIQNDTSLGISQQIGASPQTELVLYDEDIPYWFFANGRRFIVVARTLNMHTSLYAGLFLPYGTASEYPYPMCILNSTDDWGRSYLEYTDRIWGFFHPSRNESSTSVAPGTVRSRYGVWNGVNNWSMVDNYRLGMIWPWWNGDYDDTDGNVNLRDNFDGSFTLLPAILHLKNTSSINDGGSCLGELEGVYWISGGPFNEVEDTVTIGSDTYLVTSNGPQTGINAFAAIKQ